MRRSAAALVLVPVLLGGCGAGDASGDAAAPEVPAPSRAVVGQVVGGAPTVAPPVFASHVAPVTAAELVSSWRAGCPVAPEQLRMVSVSHWDLAGTARTGRIVVHADVAAAVVAVFARLFELGFPIARMEPVEAFGGSDDASMAADNTSAFNCRATTGGGGFSEHSYGTAIDVNPVENPYVRGSTVLPEAGRAFVDRHPAPGVVLAGDAVVQAFAAQGFSWGGDWNSLKDYQHFSVSGS